MGTGYKKLAYLYLNLAVVNFGGGAQPQFN